MLNEVDLISRGIHFFLLRDFKRELAVISEYFKTKKSEKQSDAECVSKKNN